MKITEFALLFGIVTIMNEKNYDNERLAEKNDVNIINISQQLLLATKTKEATDSFVNILFLENYKND
jgi:hypothetical protein